MCPSAIWSHVRRALDWDLSRLHVTPEERSAFVARGALSEVTQRYLAWRRSALRVACPVLFLLAGLATLDLCLEDFSGFTRLGVAWLVLHVVAPWALALATLLAALAPAGPFFSWRILGVGWL